MPQQTFLTPEALLFSLKQSAELIAGSSHLRIAALAQPVPYKGSWQPVRFNWRNEPERVHSFAPSTTPCNRIHWAS